MRFTLLEVKKLVKLIFIRGRGGGGGFEIKAYLWFPDHIKTILPQKEGGGLDPALTKPKMR